MNQNYATHVYPHVLVYPSVSPLSTGLLKARLEKGWKILKNLEKIFRHPKQLCESPTFVSD